MSCGYQSPRYVDTPVEEIKSPQTDYLEFLSHASLRNEKYTSPGKK